MRGLLGEDPEPRGWVKWVSISQTIFKRTSFLYLFLSNSKRKRKRSEIQFLSIQVETNIISNFMVTNSCNDLQPPDEAVARD